MLIPLLEERFYLSLARWFRRDNESDHSYLGDPVMLTETVFDGNRGNLHALFTRLVSSPLSG
jgi:hypothetical protein